MGHPVPPREVRGGGPGPAGQLRARLRAGEGVLTGPLLVGVQLHPQGAPVDALRDAWRRAEAMGADSIWVWDHFFPPLYGPRDADHWEAYTLLAAMAVDTTRARIGALVTCNSYRNPNLLADMARTVDHLSGGRFTLGLGSGWKKRDYEEYGYPFGTPGSRLAHLEANLALIRMRLDRLVPPPAQPRLPLLIGGQGEKVTLRLVAEHADAWNGMGTPDELAHKHAVIDDWCGRVGRDPAAVERTAVGGDELVDGLLAYAAAGSTHLILMVPAPYDLDPLARLLAARDAFVAGA